MTSFLLASLFSSTAAHAQAASWATNQQLYGSLLSKMKVTDDVISHEGAGGG